MVMPSAPHAERARPFAGLLLLLLAWSPGAWALNDGLGPPPPAVHRDSPLNALNGFLTASHEGDYSLAAHFLFLDHLPQRAQALEGPRLARRLRFVLDRAVWLDFSKVSKEPAGQAGDGAFDELGTIDLRQGRQPLRLRRLGDPASPTWVFSEDTVRAIDRLYAEHGPPFAERLPDVFFRSRHLGLELWQWLSLVLCLGVGSLLVLLVQGIAIALGLRVSRLTSFDWDDQAVRMGQGPLALMLFAAVVAATARFALLPRFALDAFDLVARSFFIIALAWYLLRALSLMGHFVVGKVAQGSPGEARIRGLQTQIQVLRRVLQVAIYVVAAALLLMQFSVVRSVGVSLLASAGIAGLVLGLAAQRSISTLLAGIQLSITQPIRLGDSVVVEGEMGTIEEISLSYVVVRVWDLRRLVVPMTHFLEKPFQNWSRAAPEMLGAVTLQVDYSADVEAFRAELRRILENEGKPLWDGVTNVLQVTDATDRIITLRALVGGQSAVLWDLRCLVRERLLAFLQRHPQWFPVTRTEGREAKP
jgi:small-conductance mechanosensitive channel